MGSIGWILFVLIRVYPILYSYDGPILRYWQRFELGICGSDQLTRWKTSTVRGQGLNVHAGRCNGTVSSKGPWQVPKQIKSSKQPQTLTEFIWHLAHCANKSQTNRKNLIYGNHVILNDIICSINAYKVLPPGCIKKLNANKLHAFYEWTIIEIYRYMNCDGSCRAYM